ncbi:MAG: dihydroxy-acid dehydratase [Eubacteriales bacterium]|nr:dihydroxy-acid dehydratase [Eubacteriales bacterium]
MIRAIDKLEPFQRAISKAHLAAAGVSIDALQEKPLIAIANSWNEVCPGHESQLKLAEEVRKGILEAGGEPIEFNTVAMCDGIAQGHKGMRYCLPHRELVADSIEAMVSGEGVFDGIVFIGSCDKIIPGMLMAAARINLPSVIVTAGPCYAEIKPNDSKELRQRFLRGEITERDVIEGTLHYYTGSGVCPFLGTANTMGCLCEALGMMLPGGSLIPAMTSLRRFTARNSGKAVMELINKNIRPSDIMKPGAFHNAAVLLSAFGGSLNACMHLPAIAHELGFDYGWEKIAEVSSRVPVITRIVPNGNLTVIDLYRAGGVPALFKELIDEVSKDEMTVTGRTMGENLEGMPGPDGDVIYPLDDPRAITEGIKVLKGNLAPEGALVKTSAVPEELHEFKGTAKVFDSEDECFDALYGGRIEEGDAVVIRYEGPKGGPGMREMHRVTEMLKKFKKAAVITDGRFSGASGGLSIGYLSPEAALGGLIAYVRTGDTISASLSKGTLTLEVSDDEIERRKAEMAPVVHDEKSAFMRRYAQSVASSREGAVLN